MANGTEVPVELTNGDLLALIEKANRDEQMYQLAGIDDVPSPLSQLREDLTAAIAEVDALRNHAHEWDYGDSESSPVRCRICGADGLA